MHIDKTEIITTILLAILGGPLLCLIGLGILTLGANVLIKVFTWCLSFDSILVCFAMFTLLLTLVVSILIGIMKYHNTRTS